jgi:hypothetical protein
MIKIVALFLSSLALSACALRGTPPLERGYSTHYRGYCEKHDLPRRHGILTAVILITTRRGCRCG